jgi:hypothetical protein
MLVGKPLSALLQILRAHGVTEYRTKEFHILLTPVAPKAATATAAPEASQLEGGERTPGDDDDELGDPRFLLEKLGKEWADRSKQRGS